jgi:hypothetical protein
VSARLKEIMDSAEILFEPERNLLGKKFVADLAQARHKSLATGNAAAFFPAMVVPYLDHAKALVIAKATSIATAYTSFNEAAGAEADATLLDCFRDTVAGS